MIKSLLILFLLSFGYSESTLPDAIATIDVYSFELTVNTQGEDPASFDLIITGFTLQENGSQKAFELDQQNLQTPYKLNLKNGKYSATIYNRSKDEVILSKIQGIRNGERMSAGRSDSNHTNFDFGIGGKFKVSSN